MDKLKRRNSWFALAAIAMLLLVNARNVKCYLLLDSNFLIPLILAPFIVSVDRRRPGRQLFVFLCLPAILIAHFIDSQTLFFFGLVFGLFYLIEQHIGQLNTSSFLLIALSSPAATYLFKVFGFPIRLQLTDLASSALNMVGFDVGSAGNTILLGGDEFTVEAACAGLKLLTTGFLITLMLIRRAEKIQGVQVRPLRLLALLVLSFTLIILSNFTRIIGLILFKVPEETFTHEVIGLLSLAIYTILPLIGLVPKLVGKYIPDHTATLGSVGSPSLMGQLLVALALLFQPSNELVAAPTSLAEERSINGYAKEPASFDGFKFTKKDALLYVKPCADFWRTDHNPIICWRGSGYKFTQEQVETVNGRHVFTAKLSKGADELHTAWWFQSEEESSISQLEWRWKQAMGRPPYELINVSTSSRSSLLVEVNTLLNGLTVNHDPSCNSTTPLVSKNSSSNH